MPYKCFSRRCLVSVSQPTRVSHSHSFCNGVNEMQSFAQRRWEVRGRAGAGYWQRQGAKGLEAPVEARGPFSKLRLTTKALQSQRGIEPRGLSAAQLQYI